MAEEISSAALSDILQRWKWQFDPIPEWVLLDRDQLREFAKLQVELKIKELQIEQQKLEALNQIMQR